MWPSIPILYERVCLSEFIRPSVTRFQRRPPGVNTVWDRSLPWSGTIAPQAMLSALVEGAAISAAAGPLWCSVRIVLGGFALSLAFIWTHAGAITVLRLSRNQNPCSWCCIGCFVGIRSGLWIPWRTSARGGVPSAALARGEMNP